MPLFREEYFKFLRSRPKEKREELEQLQEEQAKRALQKRLPFDRYYVSATNTYMLLLVCGVSAAVLCGGRLCLLQQECLSDGTCIRIENTTCGFRNAVRIQAEAEYGTEVSADTLAVLLRGVCSPGERAQTSLSSGALECVPYYPFPSALNAEIVDSDASTPHARACGKWIDAGGLNLGLSYPVVRGFQDGDAWRSAIYETEDRATVSSRGAIGAMSKFRAECMRTVRAGPSAVRSAAVLAYEYLETHIDTATDRNGVLRASGALAAHSCDASVRIGVYLSDNAADHFVVDVYDGYWFYRGTLGEALHLVGASEAVQKEAESIGEAINAKIASYNSPELSAADIEQVLKGATGMETIPPTTLPYTPWTNVLNAVVAQFESDPVGTRSYMRGIAAFCSYAMRSQVQYMRPLQTHHVRADHAWLRNNHAPATALGRLKPPEAEIDADRMELDLDVTNATMFNASTITFAQLIGEAGDSGDGNADCLRLMRAVFPDHVDDARFRATVSHQLYTRMEALMVKVRIGVSVAVRETPIREGLVNPDQVAIDAIEAGVRIAGAPRGSWAGIARPLPTAAIASSDGVFVQALKQAHALFLDRVTGLAFDAAADACDHPPFFDATTTNAYMLYSLRCTVLFLGMAHRPWMDEQYDDASLMARGLGVVAHELGHLTLNVDGGPWDKPVEMNALLLRYRPSTRIEAIADVVAAFGVLKTGLITRDAFLTQWCQVWCARWPPFYEPSDVASHPDSNERCDFLDGTVRAYI